MKMTKEQFIKEFGEMMRENYTVTDDFIRAELESQLAGNQPKNIIGMFMAENLKKINIVQQQGNYKEGMKVAEYKLTIVVRESFRPSGAKQGVTNEREIVTIGYFKTERELQQWAEDNLGEIDNV